MNSPFNSRLLRLFLAYTVGLNAFGLVFALTFAIGSLLHMADAVAFIGFVVAIAAGVTAGSWLERAMRRDGSTEIDR